MFFYTSLQSIKVLVGNHFYLFQFLNGMFGFPLSGAFIKKITVERSSFDWSDSKRIHKYRGLFIPLGYLINWGCL